MWIGVIPFPDFSVTIADKFQLAAHLLKIRFFPCQTTGFSACNCLFDPRNCLLHLWYWVSTINWIGQKGPMQFIGSLGHYFTPAHIERGTEGSSFHSIILPTTQAIGWCLDRVIRGYLWLQILNTTHPQLIWHCPIRQVLVICDEHCFVCLVAGMNISVKLYICSRQIFIPTWTPFTSTSHLHVANRVLSPRRRPEISCGHLSNRGL